MIFFYFISHIYTYRRSQIDWLYVRWNLQLCVWLSNWNWVADAWSEEMCANCAGDVEKERERDHESVWKESPFKRQKRVCVCFVRGSRIWYLSNAIRFIALFFIERTIELKIEWSEWWKTEWNAAHNRVCVLINWIGAKVHYVCTFSSSSSSFSPCSARCASVVQYQIQSKYFSKRHHSDWVNTHLLWSL